MLCLIGVAVAGYLLGSIPTGVIVGRLWKGIDVRQHGSTHTGGLNTLRVVGVPAGLLAGLGDVAKGMAAILVARSLGPEPWSVPLAGFAAVVGHNWSLYIGLDGGLGIATLVGTLLLFRPQVIPLAALVFCVLYLILRDRPRAAAGMVLGLGFLLWALGASPSIVLLGVLGGCASFLKHVIEIRRGYEVRPLHQTKKID